MSNPPPLRLIGLMGDGFRVYRRHFWAFMAIGLLPNLLLYYLVTKGATELLGYNGDAMPYWEWQSWVLWPLFNVPVLLLAWPPAVCVVQRHRLGLKPDLFACYRLAIPRSLPFIGLGVVVYLALFVSMVMSLLLVGLVLLLYMSVNWSCAAQVVLLEGQDPFRALDRSRNLVAGNRLKVLAAGTILVAGMIGIRLATSEVFSLADPLVWDAGWALGSDLVFLFYPVTATLVALLVYPVIPILSTLTYFSLLTGKAPQ